MRIISDFSEEQSKQDERGVKYLKYWEEKPHQSRILYPRKLSFKNDGEIETFWEKKLRNCVTNRPANSFWYLAKLIQLCKV